MPLAKWTSSKLKEYKISSFYYFSLIDNARSILINGILPKNEIISKQISFKSFADETVQDLREARDILLTDRKPHNIHDLVPLYLTPKTPTLYARRHLQDELFFIVIQSFILCDKGVEFAFSDGNAASTGTSFYYSLNNLDKIPWEVIKASSWNKYPEGTRQRNSEFLIYPNIPAKRFWRIAVNNDNSRKKIDNILKEQKLDIELVITKGCFFT